MYIVYRLSLIALCVWSFATVRLCCTLSTERKVKREIRANEPNADCGVRDVSIGNCLAIATAAATAAIALTTTATKPNG